MHLLITDVAAKPPDAQIRCHFCGILHFMCDESTIDYASFYQQFKSPISEFDCGYKCAPYNKRAVPFCCDTSHAVPTAYDNEWDYLQENTNFWHRWQSDNPSETQALLKETPSGQVLIKCLGHQHCQRDYRSITCRAFPFYPYISKQGDFLGLAYYWEYEDRCWIISNLYIVSNNYRSDFIVAYQKLFSQFPQEKDNFRNYSAVMRRVFGRSHRAIPLLHRNGYAYKISPRNGRLRRISVDSLPKFAQYKIAIELPFPDEVRMT